MPRRSFLFQLVGELVSLKSDAVPIAEDSNEALEKEEHQRTEASGVSSSFSSKQQRVELNS